MNKKRMILVIATKSSFFTSILLTILIKYVNHTHCMHEQYQTASLSFVILNTSLGN